MMNDEKVGFKFPIGLETAGKTIHLSDEFESIKEAIIIILSTQKGERIMCPDFGCRLKEYMFEPLNSLTEELIRHEIIRSLTKWEKRIEQIEVTFGKVEQGVLKAYIQYVVVSEGEKDGTEFKIVMV